MWRVVGLVLILLCTALGLSDASAQVRPGSARPGQVERQVERPPVPTAQSGPIAIPETTQTPPANAADIRFQLTQMTVDGVSVYPADAVRRTYADALQREVTLADIYKIVDSLTARYRNDGYILSQVVVPAQSVEHGVIRLQAIEGYIADVRVEGGDADLRARVGRYGQKIRAIRPLTAAALERYVLLLNDLPGVRVHAVLAPASTPGASELVLQVSQHAVQAGFSADSRGSTRARPPAVVRRYRRPLVAWWRITDRIENRDDRRSGTGLRRTGSRSVAWRRRRQGERVRELCVLPAAGTVVHPVGVHERLPDAHVHLFASARSKTRHESVLACGADGVQQHEFRLRDQGHRRPRPRPAARRHLRRG